MDLNGKERSRHFLFMQVTDGSSGGKKAQICLAQTLEYSPVKNKQLANMVKV